MNGILDRCGEDFIQLSGDDPTSLGHAVHGGKGCISVGSNIAPKQYAEFHNALMAKDFVKAQEINHRLDRLHKDLFLCPSPAPTKFAMNLLGKMDSHVRLPMTPCVETTKEAVKSAMTRAGVAI